MKLTDAWVVSRRLPCNRPKNRIDKTVDGREGLMVRVHKSGAVSAAYRYTPPRGGERVPMIFGVMGPGGLSVADVFELHHQAQRELALGLDPIEEREKRAEHAEKERRERSEAGTVNELVEQFVHRRLLAERWDAERSQWVRDAKAKTKPRKRPAEAAALLGYRLPAMPPPKRKNTVATLLSKHGSDRAREITKRQLIALFDEIVDRGSSVMANRVYDIAKQLFEFGAAKDLIPASPMAGIERPGGEEVSRKRRLSEDEIRIVWQKLPTAAMAPATRAALKLLLVTAQRRGELTFAKKVHFNVEAALWTIPVELQKTEGATKEPTEPHLVPLSGMALEIVSELLALAGDKTRWMLPSQYSKKKADAPYSERALTRAVRENREHFGIPEWTPHDLRRTTYSMMTKIGVPLLHVKKVVNHAIDEMDEVYGRHDFLPEKRAALEKWAAHLKEIIEGKAQAAESGAAA